MRPRLACHHARTLLGLALCACAPIEDAAPNVGAKSSTLVHGEDDRRDVSEVSDPRLRRLALDSTLALVSSSALRAPPHTELVIFDAPQLRSAEQLCEAQAFESQPTLARCTGVLVDEDLLLTVAHCATDFEPCESQVWAFDYAVTQADFAPALRQRDLYRCRSVPLVRDHKTSDGKHIDYALVQLDRPVTSDRAPAVLSTRPAHANEALCVIGYPSGLPVKVDCGAHAVETREAERDYLRLTSDTFRGSSGSGIFRAGGELVAVLARGGPDYDAQPDAGCRVAHQVPDGSPLRATEQASYAGPALEALCREGWTSSRLCAKASQCGDRRCSIEEHHGVCTLDCPALPLLEVVPPDAMSCQLARGHHRDASTPSALALLWLFATCARRNRARACEPKRGDWH